MRVLAGPGFIFHVTLLFASLCEGGVWGESTLPESGRLCRHLSLLPVPSVSGGQEGRQEGRYTGDPGNMEVPSLRCVGVFGSPLMIFFLHI